MTLKTSIVKVMIVLLLAGAASAAVYTMANEEGRILFGLTPEEPAATPVTTLIGGDGAVLNIHDFGVLDAENGTQEFTIIQRNAGDADYTSTVYFMITCDEGLVDGYRDSIDMPATRGLEDFVSINYTDFNDISHECNTVWAMERISTATVKVTPPMEEFTFVPGYVHYTQLDVVFNPLAHGNYTIEVHVA